MFVSAVLALCSILLVIGIAMFMVSAVREGETWEKVRVIGTVLIVVPALTILLVSFA